MMRKLKTITASLLSAVLLIQGPGFTVLADDAIDKTENLIVGFADFDVNEHYLSVDKENRADLQTLIEAMPQTLAVYCAGNDAPAETPVEWYCVDGDYETIEASYVQFSPVFTQMAVDEALDIVTEAPYIGVFLLDPEQYAEESADEECLNGAVSVSSYSYTSSPYEHQIYNYLTTNMGYNSAVACGVMANIYLECSFIPNNLQNTGNKALNMTDEQYTKAVDNGSYTNFVNDKYGYGLIQWTFWSRKQGLLNYARSVGKSIGDCQMQLDYLKKEVSAYTKLTKIMAAAPNTAQGAYDVGYNWCYIFEQPANYPSVSVTRGNLAKNTFWPIYSTSLDYKRIYGSSRYLTAIDAADELLAIRKAESFDTIVVASGRNYPDALGGVPLAASLQAPILLIGPAGTEKNSVLTMDYIKSHLTEGGKVVLLGGTGAVSELTENDLKAMNYDVVRLGGLDRYETNRLVASEMAVQKGSPIFIVSGKAFPDALSVSGVAAGLKAPIILTGYTLKDEALDYIASVEPSMIYLIGGTGAVSAAVQTQLADYPKVVRLEGKNRYATSSIIAGTFAASDVKTILAATGNDYPDGLVAGILAAELNIPLYLVNDTHTSLAKSFMTAHKMTSFYVIGGPGVVPESTVLALAK